MNDLPEVELIPCETMAKLLKTSFSKVKAGILNGTLPIGFVADGRVIIPKPRAVAWLTGADLLGVRDMELLITAAKLLKGDKS
jgi:hypothetical protein